MVSTSATFNLFVSFSGDLRGTFGGSLMGTPGFLVAGGLIVVMEGLCGFGDGTVGRG